MTTNNEIPAVTLDTVSRLFAAADGTEFRAVDRVSISVHKGEIFCLVGPDGAGKTTAIRMMCGVIAPSSGTVTVAGLDVQQKRDAVKQRIGYLSQRFSLYADLTVDENIDFFAEIHGEKNFSRRKKELLEMTRLGPFAERLAGRLSGGMKQKLALACTLIHKPEVIFLDEPTTGVDPVSRRDFWRILSTLLADGITIVVSTPYLDEAERSSRVALMSEGRIIQCDTPAAVRGNFPMQVYEVLAKDVRTSANTLRALLGERNVHIFGDRLHVISDERESGSKFPALAKTKKYQGLTIRKIQPSLEDVFIQATEGSQS